MSETAVLWVTCGWIGLAVVAMVQLALWIVAAVVGREQFRRLRRIYHLQVIAYWLGRLEREGQRTFQRPDDDEAT